MHVKNGMKMEHIFRLLRLVAANKNATTASKTDIYRLVIAK